MAFFEFLVHGAAVSVFHGSEWCGPGSLEFLAGRSEALIYQDVLSVRCMHGQGNLDNRALHLKTHKSKSFTKVWDGAMPLGLIQEMSGKSVFCSWCGSFWVADINDNVLTSGSLYNNITPFVKPCLCRNQTEELTRNSTRWRAADYRGVTLKVIWPTSAFTNYCQKVNYSVTLLFQYY